MEKRIISFLAILMGVMIMAAGVIAQEFYVGGYSDQGQYMMNDGMITDTPIWQYQSQMQVTMLGIENTPLVAADSYMEGFMAQEIGDHCSKAYTETANSTHYGLSIQGLFDISAGAGADASAVSITMGDANALSTANSNITITILP